MVHKVLVEGELRKDVAKEFRVSPSVVSRYVTKFKNAGHMQRLLQKDEHAVVKVQVVKTMVEVMMLEDKIIDSAENVCNRIHDELDIDI